MGLILFFEIFLTFKLNDGVFCRILLVPKNIVMDLNNVMERPNMIHNLKMSIVSHNQGPLLLNCGVSIELVARLLDFVPLHTQD